MKSNVQISKFLSLVLRHRPEKIELSLDENSWANVDELLEKLPFQIDFAKLEEIVSTNDKKRFAFSDDFKKIRANQGHSIQVDLNLTPAEPPEILFHGTPTNSLQSIRRQGLKKGKRHHVHLSPDVETARRVGGRRGKAVVLKILSGEMHRAGHQFFQSENGVWLVDRVPRAFLEVFISANSA